MQQNSVSVFTSQLGLVMGACTPSQILSALPFHFLICTVGKKLKHLICYFKDTPMLMYDKHLNGVPHAHVLTYLLDVH